MSKNGVWYLQSKGVFFGFQYFKNIVSSLDKTHQYLSSDMLIPMIGLKIWP